MLTQNSANAVFDLAQQVTNSNLQLLVKDESPLTALINACISPSMSSGEISSVSEDGSVPMVGNVTNFIGASRLKNAEGASEHDLVMAELTETIAAAATKNLAWARNDVAPMITSIYDQAVKDVAVASAKGVIPLVIIPQFFGAVWDRPEVAEMAERYSNTPLKVVPLAHEIKLPDGKTVKDMLDTGLGGVNAAVDELISRVGIESVETVFRSVFGKDRYARLADSFGTSPDSIDGPMITMLLANSLSGIVPEGLNVSLDGYKGYMADLVSQAGAQVARTLARRQEHRSNQRLVLERPFSGNPRGNIVVVGDVYNAWLAEGGSPEILMGAILGNASDDYRTMLLEKDRNLASYNGVANALKSELQYIQFNALIASFRDSVTKIINALPDDQLPVPRSILHANLTFRLTHVKISDLDNPYIPARKVLCRTLWHHTDVERYLSALDAAAAAHPELDVRESALLAAIDVVVEWLAGQITVTEAH